MCTLESPKILPGLLNYFIMLFYRGYSKVRPKTHECERTDDLSCEKPPAGNSFPVHPIETYYVHFVSKLYLSIVFCVSEI